MEAPTERLRFFKRFLQEKNYDDDVRDLGEIVFVVLHLQQLIIEHTVEWPSELTLQLDIQVSQLTVSSFLYHTSTIKKR